jgi:hypothetical protein
MAPDYDPAKQYLVRHAETLYLEPDAADDAKNHHEVGTIAIGVAATDL